MVRINLSYIQFFSQQKRRIVTALLPKNANVLHCRQSAKSLRFALLTNLFIFQTAAAIT